MSTLRWGILGCGDVTEVKSGPALQKAHGSSLVAVMRRNGELAQDYADRHGVPFATDNADELINRPDVDIVYVATPPGAHLDLALKVCAAGKPCYVEKPMARSAAESHAMLEAFQAANLPLFVAFYRRGLERFKVTKKLIEEGRIGPVTGVRYTYASPRFLGFDPSLLPWRLQAVNAGAGLFYDLGSHLLDVFDFIFGPLEQVSGVAKNRATPAITVEDSVSMSFLAAGAPSVAHWNFASTQRMDLIEIDGSLGRIWLSCFGGEPVKLETRDGVENFDGSLPPHVHQPLVQTIVDELRGQGKCPSTGASALRTMEVMDAVLSSYYGGRTDDFWNRENTWPGRS